MSIGKRVQTYDRSWNPWTKRVAAAVLGLLFSSGSAFGGYAVGTAEDKRPTMAALQDAPCWWVVVGGPKPDTLQDKWDVLGASRVVASDRGAEYFTFDETEDTLAIGYRICPEDA